MSNAEVEQFRKLLAAWHDARRIGKETEYDAREALLGFLESYRHPIISALQFAAR